MDSQEAHSGQSFELEFKLKRGLSLKINKGINAPTGARYEGEEFYRKGHLIMMINKWNERVGFDIIQTIDVDITYGNLGPDGRPALLLITDGPELLAALWRKQDGLLCPVPEGDFEMYAELFTEEAEPSEVVGEIFDLMEKKL